MSRKSKLKLYWSVIRQIVVYGCETWVLKESIIQTLSVFERKIFGPTTEANGINRMPKTNTVKRIHIWKPFTGRPAGRPKSRWDVDVRNDLKKMKLMKWA